MESKLRAQQQRVAAAGAGDGVENGVAGTGEGMKEIV
jgi:hypothetical protein